MSPRVMDLTTIGTYSVSYRVRHIMEDTSNTKVISSHLINCIYVLCVTICSMLFKNGMGMLVGKITGDRGEIRLHV